MQFLQVLRDCEMFYKPSPFLPFQDTPHPQHVRDGVHLQQGLRQGNSALAKLDRTTYQRQGSGRMVALDYKGWRRSAS